MNQVKRGGSAKVDRKAREEKETPEHRMQEDEETRGPSRDRTLATNQEENEETCQLASEYGEQEPKISVW